jgi:hypothetical protein
MWHQATVVKEQSGQVAAERKASRRAIKLRERNEHQ